MAVSKRTRYEVLRRDNHTCRYCGAVAPDATLTVDHVTPTALGGSDDPSNLVAACRDCNAGKASTSPDAQTVADVKAADIRWAGAIKRVSAARARQQKKRDAYVSRFDEAWLEWHCPSGQIPRPSGWVASVERFYDLGLPIDELVRLVRVACGNDRVTTGETFRYLAGCAWREVAAIQEAAKELLDAENTDGA